ncbi:MAG: beta-lactamase family protein [Clostridia bacterium]|nr:beta-lactamase family protein [Clostridia bacterium]
MNFQKLKDLIASLPGRGFPASDISVARDGVEVFRASAGYADAEMTRSVTRDDIYWVFSISKIATCIAAMRLVEEGRIDLYAPVSRYLPAYGTLTVQHADGSVHPAQNEMTVLHLFTMTGGLDYNGEKGTLNAFRASHPHMTTREFVDELAKQPLCFEPGTQFAYSLCHDVLAAVVEAVSGVRFADYMREQIFAPLGMNDTHYHLPEEKRDRLTAVYRYRHGVHRAEHLPDYRVPTYRYSDCYDSGGAGLATSVDDYMKLLGSLACGGTSPNGYRVLNPETVAMLGQGFLSDAIRETFMPTRLYGYSWGLCGRAHVDPHISDARSAKGEFGWDGAAASYALVDPSNRVSIFFATEVLGSNYAYHYLHPLLRDLAYEGLGL